MVIKVCIGNSCHLKGAPELLIMLQEAIDKHSLNEKIELMGCFCIGRCSHHGVTIQTDNKIHVGVTPENFESFFTKNVLHLTERK